MKSGRLQAEGCPVAATGEGQAWKRLRRTPVVARGRIHFLFRSRNGFKPAASNAEFRRRRSAIGCRAKTRGQNFIPKDCYKDHISGSLCKPPWKLKMLRRTLAAPPNPL
jgi:hypothetical protein